MSDLTTAIVANATNDTPVQEGIAAMVSSDKGFSGTAGTGIALTGTAHFDCATEAGFYPRRVRVDAAGYLGFRTLDDNDHLIAMDAKTELNAIFIKRIYDASHATLATTCTGVHLF